MVFIANDGDFRRDAFEPGRPGLQLMNGPPYNQKTRELTSACGASCKERWLGALRWSHYLLMACRKGKAARSAWADGDARRSYRQLWPDQRRPGAGAWLVCAFFPWLASIDTKRELKPSVIIQWNAAVAIIFLVKEEATAPFVD